MIECFKYLFTSTTVEHDISEIDSSLDARHMVEQAGYKMKHNCCVRKSQEIPQLIPACPTCELDSLGMRLGSH